MIQKESEESHARVVWQLAWPVVALNSLQTVNNLLDRFFIGHLEAAALAAQGAALNLMFLLFSLAITVSTATTALVARAYGGNRHDEVQETSRQAVRVSFALSIVLTIVGLLLIPLVSKTLLPASDVRAQQLMTMFLVWFSLGLPAMFLIQTLAGALRAIGDSKSPMFISGAQILMHMVMSFLLIFPTRQMSVMGSISTLPGFGFGLTGAAMGLSISAWVAAIGYLIYAQRTPLGHCWSWRLPEIGWAVRILKIAGPAAVMALLRVSSLTVFTIILTYLGSHGSAAIGAMSVGFAVESIMFMPAFGLAASATALVGQSLGMKRPDRAERLGWLAGHHAAIVIALLVLPLYFGSDWIAAQLVENKEAIAREVASIIRLLCLTEVLFGYAMVMIGAMQGAGDTTSPMWITLFSLWFVRIPLAWWLTLHTPLGATGAWIAISLTQALQGVFALVVFKQGRWKYKRV